MRSPHHSGVYWSQPHILRGITGSNKVWLCGIWYALRSYSYKIPTKNSSSYIIGDENLLRTKTPFLENCARNTITYAYNLTSRNLWDDGSDSIELQGKIKGQKELKLSWAESLVFGAVTSIAWPAANTYNSVEIVTSRARAMWTNMCKKDQNWNTFGAICSNAYILAWFTCWGGILRLASNCTSHCFCEYV